MWEAGPGRSRLVAVKGSEQVATLRGPATASLPQGVVTFLLTDVEGSSRLWEADAAAMRAAMSLHDELVERAVGAAGACGRWSRGRATASWWPSGTPPRRLPARSSSSAGCGRRSGLWAASFGFGWRCTAARRFRATPENYVGPALNRCARLRAVAHGGQTLVSRATYELVAERLPRGDEPYAAGPAAAQGPGARRGGLRARSPRAPLRLSAPALARRAPQQPPGAALELRGARARAGRAGAAFGRPSPHHPDRGGRLRQDPTRACRPPSETLERFPDGAWWVELAPLGDEALVGAAIAEALGVRPLPGMTPLQAAGAYLASHRALVILDNCEHLLGACAGLAEALLQAAPDVRGAGDQPRRRSGWTARRDWRVPSLSLPGRTATGRLRRCRDAVAAVRRAGAARRAPASTLTRRATRAVVASICSELDGLPLAIELAAARLRMLLGRADRGRASRTASGC